METISEYIKIFETSLDTFSDITRLHLLNLIKGCWD